MADAYLAGLLYIAGGRVTLAVAFAGAFTAVAVGLALLELRERMGLISAAVWAWLLLFYCRRYIGEMMSEQAGLALGALSVALLVRGFAARSSGPLYLGIFVLALALNARAGPFFVLPALLLTAGWHWRQSGPIRVLLMASLSVAAAFLLNFAYVKALGPPNAKIVSNYHNVVYGIIFGGNWHQAAVDIPNYKQMDESEQAREVYRRIAAAVKANPSVLVRGAVRSWSDFVAGSYQGLGAFSFLRRPRVEVILLGMSALSIFFTVRRPHRLYPLILAAGAGVFISVPFLPPADADLMRAYAATIPLMLLIPVFLLTGWRGWMEHLAPRSLHDLLPRRDSRLQDGVASAELIHFTLPYLLALLAFPLFARFVAPIHPPVGVVEKGKEATLAVDLGRTSWIELTPANETRGSTPSRVSAMVFEQGIFGSFRDLYPRQAGLLDSLARPGLVLVAPGSTGFAYIVIDSKHLGNDTGMVTVLAREVQADSHYSPCLIEDTIRYQ